MSFLLRLRLLPLPPDTGDCCPLAAVGALGLGPAQPEHELLVSKAFDSASITSEPHSGVLVPGGHLVNIIDLALTDVVTVAHSN